MIIKLAKVEGPEGEVSSRVFVWKSVA